MYHDERSVSTVSDADTTIIALRRQVAAFVHAREWEEFHNPKDLAAAIAIEAAELMEVFLWKGPREVIETVEQQDMRRNIEDEVADIVILCLSLADGLGIDVSDAVIAKLASNEVKYPADRVRGRSEKYTHYSSDL
jgi:dCTP diphosphatase